MQLFSSIPPVPAPLSVPPESAGSLPRDSLLDETYRVLRRIGAGAMGAVYLVEHVARGTRHAAKVVARTGDDEGVVRLEREARALELLDHPNIVRAAHLGQTPDGLVYIVMELLEGEDLGQRLARARASGDRLSDDEVRGLVPQLLSALAAAHAAGIVHRDLKPDNLFLARGPDGDPPTLKVVDFGVSKLRSEHPLTRIGQVLGTPVYTAPEQSRQSARVDHRADVYSVGVLLYELLTGRAPFVAPNLQQLMMMHACDTATPLLELRPDLPPAVASVIGRCLEKAPEDRFGSVTQLAEAWESAWFGRSLEELPLPRLTSLSPTPRPRPRPRPARANEGAPSPPSWLGRVALAGALLVVAAVTYAVAHRYLALSSGEVLFGDNSQATPLTSRP